MAEGRRDLAGGIEWLHGELDQHRDALTYDFRARLGLSVADFGTAVTWGEAVGHTKRLQHEFGSHYQAALAGWSFPITYGEFVAAIHAEATLNSMRPKGAAPVSLPLPWERGSITQADRDLAAEQLAEMTAIG